MMNLMLTSGEPENEQDVYKSFWDSVPILRAYWDVRNVMVITTPDRRQSRTLILSTKVDPKL